MKNSKLDYLAIIHQFHELGCFLKVEICQQLDLFLFKKNRKRNKSISMMESNFNILNIT